MCVRKVVKEIYVLTTKLFSQRHITGRRALRQSLAPFFVRFTFKIHTHTHTHTRANTQYTTVLYISMYLWLNSELYYPSSLLPPTPSGPPHTPDPGCEMPPDWQLSDRHAGLAYINIAHPEFVGCTPCYTYPKYTEVLRFLLEGGILQMQTCRIKRKNQSSLRGNSVIIKITLIDRWACN